MSASCKFEQSVLGHDEFETIFVTHHPEIYDLNDTDLRDIQVRLRKMREKERTLARQLNERPRKTLEFVTPAERFNACVASIG